MAYYRVRLTSKCELSLILIHRASRGIGLGLVRELSTDTSNIIIAAVRNPNTASELDATQRSSKATIHIVQLDVGDAESIKVVASKVEGLLDGKRLDYLINNAGYVSLLLCEMSLGGR